jgi:hypothetical protein
MSGSQGALDKSRCSQGNRRAVVNLHLLKSVSAEGWEGPRRSYTRGLLERAVLRTSDDCVSHVLPQGTAASTKNKLPGLITSMETIGAKALEDFADNIKVPEIPFPSPAQLAP